MEAAARAGPFFRAPAHRAIAIAFGTWWVLMGISPAYRFDWFLENLLVVAAALLVWRVYPRIKVSTAALGVMGLFLSLHVLGSHYTYSETPVGDWIAAAFDLNRNHYDRVIHFSFGLLMFWPLREVAAQVIGVKGKWVDLVAVLFIISMSALYEAMEWITALLVDSEAGDAFLGTQGDFFDAQKDHALAISGSFISFALAKVLARRGRLPAPL